MWFNFFGCCCDLFFQSVRWGLHLCGSPHKQNPSHNLFEKTIVRNWHSQQRAKKKNNKWFLAWSPWSLLCVKSDRLVSICLDWSSGIGQANLQPSSLGGQWPLHMSNKRHSAGIMTDCWSRKILDVLWRRWILSGSWDDRRPGGWVIDHWSGLQKGPVHTVINLCPGQVWHLHS